MNTGSSRSRIALLLVLLVASLGTLFVARARAVNAPWLQTVGLESPLTMAALAVQPNTLKNWPPAVGKRFPEVALIDHEGKPFALDSLRGKPTIVEIVAMTCEGCQAFSGGGKVGGYGGLPAQAGIKSIADYFPDYSGGLNLHDGTVNFVQIVIYNLKLKPAEPTDLASWRKHFGFDKFTNTYVLTGGKPLANRDTFNMVPGFLLLDRTLTVRFDATGHNPRNNLFRELLPAVRQFL